MTNQSQGETAPTPKPPRKLVFSKRLQGFDDTWESLIPLFEELQLFSADVANPTLDLLTFAQTAHYFSVLHLKKVVGNEGESSVEEDDSRCHPSGANPSARSQGVTFSDVEDEFEGQGSIWPSWETSEPRNGIPIGFVYLQNSQNMDDYQRSGEFNVGVIVAERHRGKGYARQAVQKAFEVAFRDQNCHRVQAVLVDSPYRDKALSLFMMSGMGHEGVRRRGFRSPWDHEVKDVTYLGLLATDWFIRDGAFFKTGKWTPAPKSLWDEMFARHQREREELLRWEEKKMSTSGLKRTNSMETIKQATASAMSDIDDDMYESESVVAGGDAESVRAGSVVSSSSSSLSSAFSRVSMESPRKRRRTSIKSEGTSGSWSRAGSEPPSSNESDSGDDIFGNEEPVDGPLGNLMVAPESHIPEGLRNWLAESSTAGFDVNQPHRGQSPTFSEDSDLTEISDGYATSTSSRWDVVERGSTPGLSDLEPDQDPLNI